MIKVVTIIGARPQIIKAAAISRAIKNKFKTQIREIIVHTGQHYDENMSQVFFDELGIPTPEYNLQVGSGSHGKQTAVMINGIEEILIKEKPNAIILYGDTNSTLAGAIAASKIHVPVVHIEAGLRSFNKAMPEEINRILCDHVSTLLFSPTRTGFENLLKEGFQENNRSPFHADNPIRLTTLFEAINNISENEKTTIILPLHPRTAKLLHENLSEKVFFKIKNNPNFKIIAPASFLEMTALEKYAFMVITDSGGVQKEAYYFNKPCIVLRPETEWIEQVECGAAITTDADKEKIIQAFETLKTKLNQTFPSLYGDGNSAEFICNEIIKNLN